MSEKTNNSFVLYTYQLKAMELLTMTERGALITAVFEYVENGTLPNLTPLLNMAFLFFKNQLDTDKSYCQEMSEKRSKAVRKRWEKAMEKDTNDTNDTNVHNNNINNNINNIYNNTYEYNIDNNNKKKILKEKVGDDEMWIESICMKHHLTKDETKLRLDEFDNHLISIGQEHNNEREFKKHFNNWLSTLKAYEHSRSNNISDRDTEKRRRETEFANYISQKLSNPEQKRDDIDTAF